MNTIMPRYPRIPDEYKEYYRIASPEDVEYSDPDLAVGFPILDAYDVLFYGYAVAREDSSIFDILSDSGFDVTIVGWDPRNGFNLYYIVHDRLYYVDSEIDKACLIAENDLYED